MSQTSTEPQHVTREHTLALLEHLSEDPLQEDATDWEALRSHWGFDAPLPEKPAFPPPPAAPSVPAAPHEDDPAYAVSLTGLDKLLSSRRIKKQEAALRRFERDRKAWDEDRLNALAHFEFAKKDHARQVAALSASYAEAVRAWRESFTAHLRAA